MDYTEWRTSDEILDQATESLDFFADFLPDYDEAALIAGRGTCVGVTISALRRDHDGLRGIDFGMLRADAERLRTVLDGAENHRHNLSRHWLGLSGWHGGAADTARERHELFAGRLAALLRQAADGPDAIDGAVTAIQDALTRYVTHLLDLRARRCGGLTAAEVRTAIADGDAVALGFVVDEFDARKAAFDAFTREARHEIRDHYDLMLTHLRSLTEEPPALPEPELRVVDLLMPDPPKSVVINQGGSYLSLSAQDGEGRVRLAVAETGGVPVRHYELDFGRAAGATGAAGTTGGPGPGGGSVLPFPEAHSGGVTPGSAAGTGPVPAGGGRARATRPPEPRLPATLFPWSTSKPVDRLHPDDDGKVVIKDGKVMITVEADDTADELTITLDDGSGNRTSYLVDYTDPANPTLRQAADPVRTGEERTP